jgi:uncharacterized membrane protein YvlD (DUF360 family)
MFTRCRRFIGPKLTFAGEELENCRLNLDAFRPGPLIEAFIIEDMQASFLIVLILGFYKAIKFRAVFFDEVTKGFAFHTDSLWVAEVTVISRTTDSTDWHGAGAYIVCWVCILIKPVIELICIPVCVDPDLA